MSLSKKDEERVRELIREEIVKAFAAGGVASMGIASAMAVTSAALAIRNSDDTADESPRGRKPGEKPFEKHNSALPIDNMTDQLEIEAMGTVAMGYAKRVESGMTPDQALVMAQIEDGFDLTPEGYDLDRGGSYFASFRWNGDAFKAAFVKKVQAGTNRNTAYEETCGEFGCNINKKAGAYRKIHEEIASGAFSGPRLAAAKESLSKSEDKLLETSLGSLGGGGGDDEV